MEVTYLPAPAYSWQSQAKQYAASGRPGIHLEQHMLDLNRGQEVFDVAAHTAGPHISVIDSVQEQEEVIR